MGRKIYVLRGGKLVEVDKVPRRKQIPRWPIQCTSMGVAASQRSELTEELSRAGVKAEISPSGDPIATSLRHKRQIASALGMVDRDSFL